MFYCCLLVRVQPLFLAWADLHHTDSLWALIQGPIVEFWLGYPIFYLGTSEFPPQQCTIKKNCLPILFYLFIYFGRERDAYNVKYKYEYIYIIVN